MSDNLQQEAQTVLCDMCTDEDRKPARKTCMKCEISMCVQHLQAHLTTPVLLQTHPLTEPMALDGTTKCPQHGKLMEYYCLDDMTCVCVSCAIEDQHRLHNMKTFSTAHKELLEKLNAEQRALKENTEDDNMSLEKWEKREREKLGRSSVRLIKAVTDLRDTVLTSVLSSVSARMVSIKTSKSSMQAAQNEKDTFRFLQMYSQVHQDVEKAKAVDLRKGLEPGSDCDKLVQEIRENGEKMMEQADHLWEALLTVVDSETHQKINATSADLIFDPQTWSPCMSLSKDNRKVFYNSWLGKYSGQMLRIRSAKSVTSYQSWVISLSYDRDWTIGLCDNSYIQDMNHGHVYGLRCKDNLLSFLTTEHEDVLKASHKASKQQKDQGPKVEREQKVPQHVITTPDENVEEKMARPQTVEVVWTFPNSLSFFSRPGQHQRIKITTLTTDNSSWDLAPFVYLEVEESQNTSDKSVPVQSGLFGGLQSGKQQCQKQWKCSCGKDYTDNGDSYDYCGRSYQKSSQATCSCGVVIGTPRISELLCELL